MWPPFFWNSNWAPRRLGKSLWLEAGFFWAYVVLPVDAPLTGLGLLQLENLKLAFTGEHWSGCFSLHCNCT